MEKGNKDKMIRPNDTMQKGAGEEYHFAGEQEFVPLTVVASSPAEAEEIWKKQRRKVDGAAQTTPEPADE